MTTRYKLNPVRIPPLAAGVATVVLIVLLAWIDFSGGLAVNTSVLYGVALLICWLARDRKLLWAMAVFSVAMTIVIGVMEQSDSRAILHRGMSVLIVLATAWASDMLVRWWQRLEVQNEELSRANDDLAVREEEVTRQNEELQSQTEELERQSEELRVSNEELAQRERMLEVLLDLSRSLHVGMPENEAMERICETLGTLVNGPSSAASIQMREAGGMRVRCHHGFGPSGIKDEFIPTERSFATLVLEQNRTGYLEDLSLRPELIVPQPAVGEAVVSVLATPLIVRGKPVGTLEVYGRSRRAWSDDQLALAESLAAQTSVSLENAQLFREVEDGRRRLQTILESVAVGLAVSDADMTDVRFNTAGAMLLGVPANTNVAEDFRRATWLVYEQGKLLAGDRFPIARAVRGERVYPHEIEVVLPGGKRLNVLSSAAPFHDADGEISGGVSSFVDITQLKQLQRELETRRREAEEANVRKTRFLAAASHDIRTPANAISLLAELLRRTADSPSMAAEIPELAEELRQSATSLVTLVSNVLDVTRFDTDKLELHETEFPLARLLEEESRQVLPLAHAKKLTLEVEPGDESIWLRADRIKLGRVLGNLLGNAIKFTDRGVIRVATKRAGNNGDVAGAGPSGVTLSVTDTGIGITPDNQSHIFDEFWQLSDPQRSKGSGLGLSISKRLVEAMGGTIAVTSAPGNGSTFAVTLPADSVISRPDADGLSAAKA